MDGRAAKSNLKVTTSDFGGTKFSDNGNMQTTNYSGGVPSAGRVSSYGKPSFGASKVDIESGKNVIAKPIDPNVMEDLKNIISTL